MVPLTVQVDLSSMEIVLLIHNTQRTLMRRHPNEFSKLSMFWKAEDMPLNRYPGSMYQKRLRDGVMIAPSRGCGIGTHRGKKRKKGGQVRELKKSEKVLPLKRGI